MYVDGTMWSVTMRMQIDNMHYHMHTYLPTYLPTLTASALPWLRTHHPHPGPGSLRSTACIPSPAARCSLSRVARQQTAWSSLSICPQCSSRPCSNATRFPVDPSTSVQSCGVPSCGPGQFSPSRARLRLACLRGAQRCCQLLLPKRLHLWWPGRSRARLPTCPSL